MIIQQFDHKENVNALAQSIIHEDLKMNETLIINEVQSEMKERQNDLLNQMKEQYISDEFDDEEDDTLFTSREFHRTLRFVNQV